MDALLSALVGALAAEWGDRSQLFVALLAARSGRPAAVLAGAALAALAASLIAGWAAVAIAKVMPLDGARLFVALALLSAGAGGLFNRQTPDWGQGWRVPTLVTAAFCCFLLAFGDRSQFLTLAVAARFDAPLLAATGATIGVTLAAAPAALLGSAFPSLLPHRAVQLVTAGLFLVLGGGVALSALRLL